jgi:hypothetical protein
VNKQGLLLEVVQVLTDLNLTISKSYISYDAGWFMDGTRVRSNPTINFMMSFSSLPLNFDTQIQTS